MCVYPCKQFVVVTIRRTGSWITIPTLPYLGLTHLLSDSDKIYRDSSSIHRLVSRKNDYSGRQKNSLSEQISNFHENSLESITIQIQSNSASTVAALLNDIFTLVVVVVVVVIIRKAEAKPNRIYQSSTRKFTFLRSTTCLSCTNTNQSIQEQKRKKTKKNQQHQHQNHDPPPHGFHPIIINLLLLHHYYQTFRNHHQKIPPKSLSRRNGNHSL